MGNHFIPQYYLNGFASPTNNKIWVYEKNGSIKFNAYAKNIAQNPDYYSPAVETYLHQEIELPANRVITKIRNQEAIDSDDKVKLATYMVVMLKRVPQSKIRMNEMAPGIAQKLENEWDELISELIAEDPAQKEYLERRRIELKASLEEYSENPPKDFWLSLIPPEKTPNSISVLHQMAWHFLVYNVSPVFLTCDNPVFYFPWMGIARPESEVTFPISSNVVLWATWRQELDGSYTEIPRKVIREINRRTALNATRFVYHAEDEAWIPKFISKNHQLNRLD